MYISHQNTYHIMEEIHDCTDEVHGSLMDSTSTRSVCLSHRGSSLPTVQRKVMHAQTLVAAEYYSITWCSCIAV